MSWLASNKNTRPQQPMGLRQHASNDQAAIQHEHKATTKNVIRKNIVHRPGVHTKRTQGKNDQVINKQASNKNTRPQQSMWLRKHVSNDQAGVQHERKATTTNVIQKKIIQQPGFHPTGTQGHNDQVIEKKCIQWPGRHPTRTRGNSNQCN